MAERGEEVVFGAVGGFGFGARSRGCGEQLFALLIQAPERGFGAGALYGIPGPLAHLLEERNLSGRPNARSCLMNAQAGYESPLLDQRHPDRSADLDRSKRRLLGFVDERVRTDVVDYDRAPGAELTAHEVAEVR